MPAEDLAQSQLREKLHQILNNIDSLISTLPNGDTKAGLNSELLKLRNALVEWRQLNSKLLY
jgi:hypothetical protein